MSGILRAHSDKGPYRQENQDSFWCSQLDIGGSMCTVMLMCDGMGGLNAGRQASVAVVKAVRGAVLSGYYKVRDVMLVCNSVHSQLVDAFGNSGTTMTYLWSDGVYWELVHIGDSRAYKKTDRGYELISQDHSVVAEYARAGRKMTPEFERKHRSMLTRCIGMGTPRYYTNSGEVGRGFLLCSDGFWHNFDGGINLRNLEEAVGYCIDKGESDNVTVMTLDC